MASELVCRTDLNKLSMCSRHRIKSADDRYESEHVYSLLFHIVVVLQETTIAFVIGAEICASKFAGAVDLLIS